MIQIKSIARRRRPLRAPLFVPRCHNQYHQLTPFIICSLFYPSCMNWVYRYLDICLFFYITGMKHVVNLREKSGLNWHRILIINLIKKFKFWYTYTYPHTYFFQFSDLKTTQSGLKCRENENLLSRFFLRK